MNRTQTHAARVFASELISHGNHLFAGGDIGGGELANILHKLTALEVATGGPYRWPGTKNPDAGFNLAIAFFLASCDVRLPKLDTYLSSFTKNRYVYSDVFDEKSCQVLASKYYQYVQKQRDEREMGTQGDAQGRIQSSGGGKTSRTENFPLEEKRMIEHIRHLAEKRFRVFPEYVRENARAIADKIIGRYTDRKIPLMPYYMREALGKKGARFSDDTIAELGMVNIFFWGASIVYDDFWDEDEAALPKLLPSANIFARHYTDFFSTGTFSYKNSPKIRNEVRTFFHSLMDNLDAANTWETIACRMRITRDVLDVPVKLPDYKDYVVKFYPAAGHILGPVVMFAELGFAPDSKETGFLIDYFKHYLVALQLNDDSHDWKEDLSRGHISTAVHVLLGEWKKIHPDRNQIHLKDDMPELERIFWFNVLMPLSESALVHSQKSRRALNKLSFLENPSCLDRFITSNEVLSKKAIAEQQRSVDFLNSFKKS